MSVNSLSSLTLLRQNIDSDGNTILEICNPEKNTVDIIPQEMLANIQNIQKVMSSVKSRLSHEISVNAHYSYWQEKGWYKSIDYYVSSREYSFKQNNAKSSNLLKDCNFNIRTHDASSANVKKQFSVHQALIHRRTKRVFKKKPVSKEIFYDGIENASIFNAINGIKLYFIVYNVEEINPAVYYYNFQNLQLDLVQEGHFFSEMSNNIQGMNTPKTAAFTIILVADFENLMKAMPYPRGLRDTYIEAGRLSQKLLISYQQYGVFSLVTPALRDRDVSRLLKLKEQEFAPLYSITFGYPVK